MIVEKKEVTICYIERLWGARNHRTDLENL